MTRVALYARYSSDNQNAASIDDQFRLCREHAEREGWTVIDTYQDAAISGASVTLRPGMQTLFAGSPDWALRCGAGRGPGQDKPRSGRCGDAVQTSTLCERRDRDIGGGRDLRTTCGLEGHHECPLPQRSCCQADPGASRGRVEQGKSGGGLCYGYDVVKESDSTGEPLRGGRTINPTQAEVVRRVFRDFAAGISPRALARRLNDEGIPGPSGVLWTDSTLRGHAKRGTGLINNELYIGRLVWNRLRYIKDPTTGKRVSRLNPTEQWIVKEVPELRIIDDNLWQAVKDRQAELAIKYAAVIKATRKAHANRLNQTHRPRALLSGLIFCGCCEGPYSLRGQDRYACSNHVMNGSCKNSRTIARSALEERMLAGLRDRLMAPEVAAEAMRAYVEETNRLNRERRSAREVDRKALSEIEKKLNGIIAAIEDGGYTRALTDHLHKLEAEQDELTERLSKIDIPDIHPNVANIYKCKVERLAEALLNPQERDEAAAAIRGLIERITLTPGPKRGQIDATLHGDFRTVLEWAAGKNQKTDTPFPGVSVSVVAGGGFEPSSSRL